MPYKVQTLVLVNFKIKSDVECNIFKIIINNITYMMER